MFLYVSITEKSSVVCPQKNQVFIPNKNTVSCKCQKGCTGRCKCKSFEESTCTKFCGCAEKCYGKILS